MEDRAANGTQERVVNFALLIRHIIHPDGRVEIQTRSENQGIPDAEIAITVQAWADALMQHLKDQRMSGLSFGLPPSNPDDDGDGR